MPLRPIGTSAADPRHERPDQRPRPENADDDDVHARPRWINIRDHEAATVGITHHAHALGDGSSSTCRGRTHLQEGRRWPAWSVVKAAADLFMPVTGEIVEVNEALKTSVARQHRPAGNDWFFRSIAGASMAEFDQLMDAPAYDALLKQAPEPARRLTPSTSCRQEASMLMSSCPRAPTLRELGERRRVRRAATSASTDADEQHMLGDRRRRAGRSSRTSSYRRRSRNPPMGAARARDRGAGTGRARALAAQNRRLKSFIGQGYHGTHARRHPAQHAGEPGLVHRLRLPGRDLAGPHGGAGQLQTMVTTSPALRHRRRAAARRATAAAEAMTL